MMKRMTAWKQAAVLGMAVCMTAGLVGCGSKEAADTTADATTEAADTETTEAAEDGDVRTVRIGIGNAYNPFCYLDENEELAGYEYEVLKVVDERLPQYEFQYEPTEFSNILVGIDTGSYDMGVHGFGWNEERAQKYLYSEVPSVTTGGYVIIGAAGKDYQGIEDLAGKKILVTAGPTQEAIDPVRYITNHSTGKMGYAIARAGARRGAEVTLVSGPVNQTVPLGVTLVPVVSARDMFEAVTSRSAKQDAIIKSAAVADYRPAVVGTEKTKKSDGDMSIALERTDDILSWLGDHRREGQFLCGFSMETQNMLENSKAKLEKKHVDMIVANNLKTAGAGFGTDTNVVTLITKDGAEELEKMSKDQVAHVLLDRIFHR